MKFRLTTLCLALAFLPFKFMGAQTLQDVRIDVIYLASDYLEGREAGKRGEDLAAEYVTSRFAKIGLLPKGLYGEYAHY
jgi:hypothetical protein